MDVKHNFKELKVWQKSIALVKDIFLLMKKFPTDEKFGLVSQMKRAAVSIPSNIAEGSGRNNNKEFQRFLNIAISSSYELETQLIISCEIEYLRTKEFEDISNNLTEIQKMIFGLERSLV